MRDAFHWLSEHGKNVVDALSATVLVGTLVNMLPSVAAVLTIFWTVLRIYDWFEARFEKRRLPPE